jgi:hypothetical protein
LSKEKVYAVQALSISRKLELLGMSEAAEAVYEGARLVIDPLPFEGPPADASTVEQKKEHAFAVLKAALEDT